MFNKILVCLDGSEIAEGIISFVKEEALAMGSGIILLRVVSLPGNLTLGVPGFPSVPFHTSAMPEQLKKEYSIAETYLKRIAQPIREQGIKVKCETLLGLPGPAIISYANENNIDLIAISSHGHSGLRNVLLGSVAEYIVRESGLPIMMIRPK
ncbi:MAG: universal stress protein [Dehalococcoidales bacterium]|nr:universal stress protein [Dehalococcoidales bacterium]